MAIAKLDEALRLVRQIQVLEVLGHLLENVTKLFPLICVRPGLGHLEVLLNLSHQVSHSFIGNLGVYTLKICLLIHVVFN